MIAGAPSGADRSRHRARARHRSAHDVRVAARPPPGCTRRLSRSSSPSSSRCSRTTCPPDHPFARLDGTARRAGAAGGRGCSARRRRARSGRRSSASPTRSPISSIRAGAELAQLYRDRFQPSARRETPWVAAAVSTICAETDEEAERLAASARMAIALLHAGRLIPVPPVEKALAFFAEHDVPPTGRRAVVGSSRDGPSRARARRPRLRRRRADARHDHARS